MVVHTGEVVVGSHDLWDSCATDQESQPIGCTQPRFVRWKPLGCWGIHAPSAFTGMVGSRQKPPTLEENPQLFMLKLMSVSWHVYLPMIWLE